MSEVILAGNALVRATVEAMVPNDRSTRAAILGTALVDVAVEAGFTREQLVGVVKSAWDTRPLGPAKCPVCGAAAGHDVDCPIVPFLKQMKAIVAAAGPQ